MLRVVRDGRVRHRTSLAICGAETPDFGQVPEVGDLEAWTVTDEGIVRWSGWTARHLVPPRHRGRRSWLARGGHAGRRCGPTSPAVTSSTWSASRRPPGGPAGARRGVGADEPIQQLAYAMRLAYEHAYGHYYGTLFDGIAHRRHIRRVAVPAGGCWSAATTVREGYVPTSSGSIFPDTGVVQGCSVVHSVRRPAPVADRLRQDPPRRTSTRPIHIVGGLTAEEARQAGGGPARGSARSERPAHRQLRTTSTTSSSRHRMSDADVLDVRVEDGLAV